MRKNTSVAVALLLLFFLLPLIFLARDPLIGTDPQETPEATLPLEQAAAQTGEEDSTRTVRVQQKDGTVITLTMEEYLWRVVAAEMPASFELEALKAQAIAARTYTLSRMATVHANHPDADVCTDYACCQAYITQEAAAANWGENGTAYADKITAAVAETDGQVIVYEGQPIQAVFFSSSAGRTVDAVEVWGNAVPYLTSVVSPEGDEVPNYHTEVTLTADEFRKTFLAAYPAADLSGEPSGWFGAVTPTSAGGVSSMEVGGVSVSGTTLRTLFSLRSTSFSVSAGGENVTFSVTGYGHGVGMSQYGANALAAKGMKAEEIITWYYSGVTVEKNYAEGG